MALCCLVLALLPRHPHLERGIPKILDHSTAGPLGNRQWLALDGLPHHKHDIKFL